MFVHLELLLLLHNPWDNPRHYYFKWLLCSLHRVHFCHTSCPIRRRTLLTGCHQHSYSYKRLESNSSSMQTYWKSSYRAIFAPQQLWRWLWTSGRTTSTPSTITSHRFLGSATPRRGCTSCVNFKTQSNENCVFDLFLEHLCHNGGQI